MGLLGQGHFLEEVFWSACFLYFTGWRIALLVLTQLSYIAEWYKPAFLWEVVLEIPFSWRARGPYFQPWGKLDDRDVRLPFLGGGVLVRNMLATGAFAFPGGLTGAFAFPRWTDETSELLC